LGIRNKAVYTICEDPTDFPKQNDIMAMTAQEAVQYRIDVHEAVQLPRVNRGADGNRTRIDGPDQGNVFVHSSGIREAVKPGVVRASMYAVNRSEIPWA
jgi:hypothetical protein